MAKPWSTGLKKGSRFSFFLISPTGPGGRSCSIFVWLMSQLVAKGAPLIPFFHFALAKRMHAEEPLAFLNIGGVANATWIDPSKPAPSRDGACLAFDTGSGNALINDWMEGHTGTFPWTRTVRPQRLVEVHLDRLGSKCGGSLSGAHAPQIARSK